MRNKNSCCFINCGNPNITQIEAITVQLNIEIKKLIDRGIFSFMVDGISLLDELAEPIIRKYCSSNDKVSLLKENPDEFLIKRTIIDKCDYCICSICDDKHESDELEYAFSNNLKIVPLSI